MDFSCPEAPCALREDLVEAHRRAWKRLAEPGTWWNGAERVALAAETRAAEHCGLCAQRKAVLSVDAVQGAHDRPSEIAADLLPDAAVEAVHRIRNDSGRLTKSWYRNIVPAVLSEGEYVELVGTLVSVLSIDTVCRAIGVPLYPLPEPTAGEPSGYCPHGLQDQGAWVATLPESAARGEEEGLYGAPLTGAVIRAMSRVPDEVRGLIDLSDAQYLPIPELMRIDRLETSRALDRSQLELLAARVSVLNECFY